MNRNIDLDAHASSCTPAAMSRGGKRMGGHRRNVASVAAWTAFALDSLRAPRDDVSMNRTADRHGRTTRDAARVAVFAMMVFAPGPAIVAQHAERLTSWTSPVLPVAEYVARRRAALAVLGPNDVLLVPSAEGTSSGDTFRQSDDFEYLVGLEIPRAVLMVSKARRRSWLFVPARDPNFENAGRPNDFPGRMLASDPALRALSGVDSVLTDDALPGLLASLASAGGRTVINGAVLA